MAFYFNEMSRCNIVIADGSGIDRFAAYGKGYFGAARVLVGTLLARSGFADYEAFPVVFLYRHSLELYLKHLIYRIGKIRIYEQEGHAESLSNTHSLPPLAARATKLLKALFPADLDLARFCQLLEQTCRDFDAIDQSSFVYRYPVDRFGDPASKTRQCISLDAFAMHMDETLNGLDAIYLGLDIKLDQVESALAGRLEEIAQEPF